MAQLSNYPMLILIEGILKTSTALCQHNHRMIHALADAEAHPAAWTRSTEPRPNHTELTAVPRCRTERAAPPPGGRSRG